MARCEDLLARDARELDSVRLAIEYEASATVPDEAQLGHLYEKLDGLQSLSMALQNILSRVHSGKLTSPDHGAREVMLLANEFPAAYSPTLTIFAKNIWLDLQRRMARQLAEGFKRVGRALADVWRRFKAGVSKALAAMGRAFGGRIRPLSRRKALTHPSPLAPLPLAAEQAPGAASGAIRGEVRHLRRFF